MRPLLALFLRAMREDVRSKGTYLLRAGLVLLILFFLWVTHMQARWTGAVGRNFFSGVLWIDLFIISVAGLGYFASAITEEKEDGTLGLLRMTDLNALAILLGKSTGRLVGALFLLAAQIPFALVAVTMGGVSVGQILAGYGCLLSFTFLLANVGLLASVVCRRSTAAAVLAGGAVAALILVPALIGWMQAEFARQFPILASLAADRFIAAWWELTPIARLTTILRTGFSGAPLDAQALASVAVGLACFALAWLLFEPCTQRALDGNETGSARRLRRSARSDGLGPAAVAAKEFRTLGGSGMTFIKILTTIFTTGVLCAEASRHRVSTEGIGAALFFTSGAVLLVFLSIDAGRVFRLERQQKTLASL
ncbi:MAG: hypothetical protein ABMA13_23905, partial [Chthoniobacteraceae bacterium]